MTARKVHFDFHAEQTEAYCGATPRTNAAPLELSERRKDVDCINCLALIAEYDDEVNSQVALAEAIMDGDVPLDGPSHDNWTSVQSIANRNGVTPTTIMAGLSAGYLKR